MNIELPNDVVRAFGIHVLDSSGTVVPAASGDVFTVTSSAPTQLNAVLGALADGTPAAVLNALVPSASGITFIVSDADGLTAFSGVVDITEDLTPTAVTLDLAHPVDTKQPVPTGTTAAATTSTTAAAT